MLTARQVTTINHAGRFHDGHGLYLQVRVTPRGITRTWLYVYMIDRRQRQMGLGAADLVSLAEARELAHAARRLVKKGADPIEVRRAERGQRTDAVTFRQASDEYVEMHAAGWRNPKTGKQFRSSLQRHAGSLMDVPVDAITVEHVLGVLTPIWGKTPVMAEHVRAQIAMVLDAAKARRLRGGDNPAAWRGTLRHVLPGTRQVRAPRHHPSIGYEHVPVLMAELARRRTIAALALRFVVLTACRTAEAINATWDEIDLDARTWMVPGAKMKSGRSHTVPLAPAAVELLTSLPREADNVHVFVGHRRGRGLSNMSMQKLLKDMRPGATVHGMRAAFRTWAQEQTTFAREIAEAALAHVVGDATERAYARSDVLQKRRELMTAWAEFCGAR